MIMITVYKMTSTVPEGLIILILCQYIRSLMGGILFNGGSV